MATKTVQHLRSRTDGVRLKAGQACFASRPAVPAPVIAIMLLAITLGMASGASAATYYVDQSLGTCSNSGPGTEAQPYCTISAALAAHAGPGTTIYVKPGTYRELVTVPASGGSGNPLVIQALGSPVVVDGADDFSSSAKWANYSGDVWLASSVTWSPKQVFADGARLSASTASPASLPARTFRYVSGAGLYVNAGGGNPASHLALVGHRANAFLLSGKSWVVIDGFTLTHADDKGIYASSSANDVTLSHLMETFANRYGIHVSGCARTRIASCVTTDNADHGIALTGGTTGCTIEDNASARNILPSQRQANGLYLYGAPSNLIRRNKWHDNQDTGEQIQSGSNNCISYNNLSWNNGDHGYDHLNATGTQHISDVAYGNYRDGFSIEGTSSGTSLYDCIAIENGLTTTEFDLWVDQASSAGFVSNDNIFWNSTSEYPVKFISTLYTSVAAYSAASGQDTRSLQANPKFVDPAHGDFRLQPGSPAIDNANSSVTNWPVTDAAGSARVDDPGTPNTGLGPVPYADRGALEYQPTGQPPVALLNVTPNNGTAPLAVIADATSSFDPDGTISTYRFDFGDGTIVGPQAGATANHTYAAGNWTCALTVTDNSGNSSSTTATVTSVGPPDQPPVAALTVTPNSGMAPLTVHADASGSSDPDGTVVSYMFSFGDGTTAGPQAAATADHVYAAGNWTCTVTVRDNSNSTASTSAAVSVSPPPNQPPVAHLTVNPSSGTAPLSVFADASTSVDPDGTITAYTFDFGDGTIVGPQSAASASHPYTAGTWTCTVTVKDNSNATASTSATVTAAAGSGNLCGNPSFEVNTGGWNSYSSSTLLRVSGGHDGTWSLQMTAPAGTGSFGVNDSPNWVATTGAVGTRFRFSAWVMSATATGSSLLQIREYTGATKIGATVKSASVKLSPTWQQLTVDFVTGAAGSTLDFQVVDYPVLAGEVFQTDDISIQTVTAAAAGPVLAAQIAEEQPLRPVIAPSPITSFARLEFTTSQAGPLNVDIFDLAGRLVRRLANDGQSGAGHHAFTIDGRDDDGQRLAAGVYLYRIRAAEGVRVGRFVIVH